MDRQVKRLILPALVFVGVVALLQWHGCQFWTRYAGAAGWAWSFLLELVALWLWSDGRRTRKALGLVASLLLLAGPLLTVAMPLVDAFAEGEHAQATRAADLETLHEGVRSAEEALTVSLRNSEKRAGWAVTIQANQAELARARESLRKRMNRPDSQAWESVAVILMQAAGLVPFQVAAVMAIRTLAEHQPHSDPVRNAAVRMEVRSGRATSECAAADAPVAKRAVDSRVDSETAPPVTRGVTAKSPSEPHARVSNASNPSTPTDDPESLRARAEELQAQGVSQRRIAATIGVSQSTVSRLLGEIKGASR